MPKWQLTNNKIIIRNVPDSECYKKMTKNFMLENFCEEGNDIHEYGNIWTIDITKKNINAGYADDIRETRGPEQERACCNTCSTFAVSANIICACMSTNPHPFYVGCKIACVMFVEQIKQACEWCCYHGGYEEKCWKNFQTWKLDYSKEQPDCPKPPAQKCR